ncbi:phage regulatory protein, partial [Escherichia coli]
MRFSEIAAVYFHALNKMLVSGAHTQWKLIDLQSDLFTVVFDSIVHELKHNKIVMVAQCVDSTIPGRYTAQAPYKAGAGRENPRFNIEHNRAHAVFSCHEHRYALIMVGRAGPTSVGPGSMLTGFSPLYVSPPIAVRSLGGEFIEFNIGAVTMTTLPTQSHPEITIINGRVVTTSLA